LEYSSIELNYAIFITFSFQDPLTSLADSENVVFSERATVHKEAVSACNKEVPMKTKTTYAFLNPLNNRSAITGQSAAFALLRPNKQSAGWAQAERPALLKTRPGAGWAQAERPALLKTRSGAGWAQAERPALLKTRPGAGWRR
jgi:hypothetical protein